MITKFLLALVLATTSGPSEKVGDSKTVAIKFAECGSSAFQNRKIIAPDSSVFTHNDFVHAKLKFFFSFDTEGNIVVDKEKSDVKHAYSRIAVGFIKDEFNLLHSKCLEAIVEFFPND